MGLCCIISALATLASSAYIFTLTGFICSTVGTAVVAVHVFKLLNWLYKFIMVFYIPTSCCSKNFRKKYGEWAIVTGCTDGIGKAYALQLANKYGMNLVLMSRTQSKLNDLEKEINTKCVKIAVDFSTTDLKIYEGIEEQIKDLDIGVLINNVGASYNHPDYFHKIPISELNNVLAINLYPQTFMTNIVLKGMEERKRGLIVSLSSFSSYYPMGLLAAYSSAKEYNKFLSESIRRETKHVTMQTIMPYFVVSKLSKIRKPSLFTPMPDKFVSDALKTVGHYDVCGGYRNHIIMIDFIMFLKKLPIIGCILETVNKNVLTDTMKRAYKKKNAKKD